MSLFMRYMSNMLLLSTCPLELCPHIIPPPVNLKSLAQAVRSQAMATTFKGEIGLPITFTGSCPGMDRRTFNLWIERMIHGSFDCSDAVIFANSTKGQLEDALQNFAKLKQQFGESETVQKLEESLRTACSHAKSTAQATRMVMGKVRTFLVKLMEQSGMRICDEEIIA